MFWFPIPKLRTTVTFTYYCSKVDTDREIDWYHVKEQYSSWVNKTSCSFLSSFASKWPQNFNLSAAPLNGIILRKEFTHWLSRCTCQLSVKTCWLYKQCFCYLNLSSHNKGIIRLFTIYKKFPENSAEKWNTAFRIVPVENFWKQQNLWKDSLVFFRKDSSKQKLILVSGGRFWELCIALDLGLDLDFGKRNWFVPMTNTIPEWNSPVLNFTILPFAQTVNWQVICPCKW